MNKRQAKKRRNKFIAMNDYPTMPFSETQCPYCGWEYDGITDEDMYSPANTTTIREYKKSLK